MWYFKTTSIDTTDSLLIEKSLRQFATKRNTLLDFPSSATNSSNTKLFLGIENEKEFSITRIGTPFESMFPKLILKFDKLNGYTKYQVRLSLLSFIILTLIAASMLLNMLYAFIENSFSEDLIFLPILFLIFFLFAFFEYHLTKSKLNTAIKKTEETNLTFN